MIPLSRYHYYIDVHGPVKPITISKLLHHVVPIHMICCFDAVNSTISKLKKAHYLFSPAINNGAFVQQHCTNIVVTALHSQKKSSLSILKTNQES
jgi:hypothetical protein